MGIAYQIKKRLPNAFEMYRDHCSKAGVGAIGQCLLIPPLPADYEVKDGPRVVFSPRLWVACLFTSAGYGKKNAAKRNPGKDGPQKILGYTQTALQDLRAQLEAFGFSNFDSDENWKTDDEKPGRLLAVKLNSGAFEVPWGRTEVLIKQIFAGFERPLHVFDPKVAPQPATYKRRNEGSPWVIPDQKDD
jgi:Macro domain